MDSAGSRAATVLSARLDSAGTRIAACSNCQSGSITSYRLVDALGATIATVWNGRSLPAGVESWQATAAQTDQSVAAAWQASSSQLRVVLTANMRTGNAGSATVTLGQDEISLIATYLP